MLMQRQNMGKNTPRKPKRRNNKMTQKKKWIHEYKIDPTTLHTKKTVFNRILKANLTPRESILINILWYTGKRITEIRLLRVQDIDFENYRIWWNILKKRKPYQDTQPMHPHLSKELKQYIKQKELKLKDHIFKTTHPTELIPPKKLEKLKKKINKKMSLTKVQKILGLTYHKSWIVWWCLHKGLKRFVDKSLSRRRLEKILQNISEKVGLHITARGMRHSINTHMSELGIRTKVRQSFNSHSSSDITLIYDNITKKDVRKAVNKI